MRVNPILVFCDKSPYRKGDTPGDANTVQKPCFCTFRATGTVGRKFYTARHQAIDFWVLGATVFSRLHSFHKTAFTDSLTV